MKKLTLISTTNKIHKYYDTQFRKNNEEGASFGRHNPSESCAFFVVFFKLKGL